MKAFARKHAVSLLCLIFWLGVGAACAPRETPAAAPAQAASADTRFALTLGTQTVQAELAVSEWERAKGLMYRTQLVEGDGMLFVFEAPAPQSFWMKNTEIPLDLGYFTGDGVLQEVKPLYPHDLAGVNSARADIAFALEMPQGWFARHNVQPGDRLNLAHVKAALAARGFSPKAYGL